MKLVLFTAGVLVAVTSLALGHWWTAACVPVVFWAAFRWRPSWRRARAEPAAPAEPVALPAAVEELEQLRRWRVVIVTIALVAVALNGWAYLRVITQGTHWGTSLLTTAVAFVLSVWGLRTQYQIERIEDSTP